MFATVEDLRKSWRTWPENLDAETAEGKLEEASDWLKAEYDVTEQPVSVLARALRIVVMAMAKRALLGDGHEGVSGDMKVAGNFTHQQQFRNSEGALFLTGQERQMLENALGASAGAVSMEARGW